MKRLADRQDVVLEILNQRGEIFFRTLNTDAVDAQALDADFTRQLGLSLYQPKLRPVIGVVSPNSVAAAEGLLAGDLVTAIDGHPVASWSELATAIREAPGKPIVLTIVRGGTAREIKAVPRPETEGDKVVGRIGIGVQDDPELRAKFLIEVRLGPFDALTKAVEQTWDTSIFSLRMIGRMLIGEQSWKNISGPVTIADYAGQSARLGLDHFVKFLALISISLGVLNLLPIPILDGGHLMYYLIEVIKGGPLSERVMAVGQQIGMGMLALLMAFAFYNDINRLISG
jgi:regulator of sigma E protease